MKKICPLCNKELIKISPEPNNTWDMYYECPTQVNTFSINKDMPYLTGKNTIHGHFDIDGDGLRAYYTEDYEVIEVRDNVIPSVFFLYRRNKDLNLWIRVAEVPPFEITSPEQMIRRIKTYVVFS